MAHRSGSLAASLGGDHRLVSRMDVQIRRCPGSDPEFPPVSSQSGTYPPALGRRVVVSPVVTGGCNAWTRMENHPGCARSRVPVCSSPRAPRRTTTTGAGSTAITIAGMTVTSTIGPSSSSGSGRGPFSSSASGRCARRSVSRRLMAPMAPHYPPQDPSLNFNFTIPLR